MAGKENDDFELNLKDADGGVGSIDALLAADGNDAPAAETATRTMMTILSILTISALTIWIRR